MKVFLLKNCTSSERKKFGTIEDRQTHFYHRALSILSKNVTDITFICRRHKDDNIKRKKEETTSGAKT